MVDRLSRHRPVMVSPVLEALAPAPGRLLLDATAGDGGHLEAWLDACGQTGRAIGLDRDASALGRAEQRLARFGERVLLRHADYRDVAELLDERELAPPDAVLLDLGIGSHQLDDASRGFSFRLDGPLDMRFDREQPGVTAAELLAHASEPELTRIFRE
ncbi:MAG: 16S rRNA (cytosine(1402)-N(4))-methyltransferase, partial [Acidobacteriota bacterium]